MVYRSLHGLAPDYLSSKFEKRETAYNLRESENKVNVPLPRTNYYKNSFTYSGAILWTSLPSNVRHAESLGQFKSECPLRPSEIENKWHMMKNQNSLYFAQWWDFFLEKSFKPAKNLQNR